MTPALQQLAPLVERVEGSAAFQARWETLVRAGTRFLPDRLHDLTADDFAAFLRIWPGISRYGTALTQDMGALRAGIARLLDDAVPIESRLEWLWPASEKPLPGLGKSVGTPLLFVARPGSFGIWNSVSESAMQRLGLMPSFPRGWSPARQYLLVNRVMVTAAEQLSTDVWTLDSVWPALIALWVRDAARNLAYPVQSAWLNRNVESSARATTISMTSQADALGQVLGGPGLGALATRTTIPTALSASGLLLVPAAALFWRIPRDHRADS